MEFDLDQVMSRAERTVPWDFRVRIGGQSHGLRPPQPEDAGRFTSLQAMAPGELQAFFVGLFAEPAGAAAAAALAPDAALAVLTAWAAAYVACRKDRAKAIGSQIAHDFGLEVG